MNFIHIIFNTYTHLYTFFMGKSLLISARVSMLNWPRIQTHHTIIKVMKNDERDPKFWGKSDIRRKQENIGN